MPACATGATAVRSPARWACWTAWPRFVLPRRCSSTRCAGISSSSCEARALSTVTRILGIDPGLRTTGSGVVEATGPQLRYLASGTIKTDAAASGDLPGRLKIIFEGICEVVERYRPDVASVEIVFVNVNPQSTLLLGQARGAALAALVSRALPVNEYTALQMKKAVVGHGMARKEQVQEMAMRLLALPGLPGKDAADAL